MRDNSRSDALSIREVIDLMQAAFERMLGEADDYLRCGLKLGSNDGRSENLLNDRPAASGTRLGGFERLVHTIFVFHQFACPSYLRSV